MNLFINYRDFYETFQKNNTILDVYNHLEYIPANGKGVVLDNSLAPKINSKKNNICKFISILFRANLFWYCYKKYRKNLSKNYWVFYLALWN